MIRFGASQIFPLILLSVGIAALVIALGWDEPAAFQQISSNVWPVAVSIALIGLAAATFFENLREETAQKPVTRTEFELLEDLDDDETTPGPQGWLLVAGIVAAALLLETLGYWVVLSLLLLLLGSLLETRQKRLRVIVTAVLLPGAVFLLFTRVFSQYLPVGFLESIL